MTGALAADLCELNMAASYLWRGMVGPATFSLLSAAFRPAGRPDGHGLEDCLTFLERFHFDEDERARLGDTLGFNEPALDAFRRLRFTGEVWAVPEGRMVFAGEPLLGVTAPIAEAQLVEIVLLNQVTFHTAVASKAARCRIAAAGADLVDFAFRRTHGVDAAMAVARASAIVGFVATSNVEAARRFGLQAAGTMAHSFIEAFPDQRAAFRAFAEDYPGRCTFLVDTYDTLGGVRGAIDVIRQLGLRDQLGVRLDSGDLGALAVRAAPIDAYGVGTKMGVSADAPYLDSAYELVAYGDRPVLKLSPEKATVPGRKQVFRAPDAHRELVGLREEPRPRATSCCWCR